MLTSLQERIKQFGKDSVDVNTSLKGASSFVKAFANSIDLGSDSLDGFNKAARINLVQTKAQGASFSTARSLIASYNNSMETTGLSQSDFASAVSKSNTSLGGYLSSLNGAKASTAGYVTSMIGAKAATIGLQIAATALNMALTAGISIAISAIVSSISKYINAAKEARQSAMDAADEAKTSADSVLDLYSAYQTASKAYENNTGSKEDLNTATMSLLSALGYEGSALDDLTSKYGTLDDAINQVTIEGLKSKLSDLTSGLQASQEELVNSANKLKNFGAGTDASELITEGIGVAPVGGKLFDPFNSYSTRKSESKYYDILSNAGIQETDKFNGWMNEKVLDFGDSSTFEGITEVYENLQSAKAALEAEIGTSYTREELVGSEIYQNITARIDALGDSYDTAKQYITDINTLLAQIDYIQLTQDTGIPQTVDELNVLKQTLISNAEASGEYVGSNEEIEAAIDSYLSSIPELANIMVESTGEASSALISFQTLMSDTSDDSFSTNVSGYIDDIDTLQDALESFKSGDLSQSDIVKLTMQFPSLIGQTDNLDAAIVQLMNNMNNDIASQFSSQFGKLSTEEDKAQLQAFENEVLKLGTVVGNTEFSIDIDTEVDSTQKLYDAMKESYSATGLTADSVKNLKERYAELDQDTVARLFEKTANGIHLNESALSDLEIAYEKQTKGNIDTKLKGLVDQYDDLTRQINNASDAATSADLYAQRADILTQIEDTSTLAAQYEGLTSNFYKWQQAQEIGEEGDMYDSLTSGLESIQELWEKGLLGTNEFESAVQLMSNLDLAGASVDELNQAYEEGYPKMQRYFTDSEEGIFNFLNDAMAANSEWVKLNEDGSWDIDFGLGQDQDVADALGINVESVQAIMRKLSDYKFDINLDSMYSGLSLLQSDAEKANDKLKELGKTDYTFNFNTNDLDYVNEQIDQAQATLNKFVDSNGIVNLDLDGAEEAQQILATLIERKQSLSAPSVMSVDTSGAESGILEVVQQLQNFQSAYNTLEINTAVHANTSEAQANVDALVSTISNLDPSLLAKLNIDTTNADSILASIQNLTPQLLVEAGVDSTLVDNYVASETTKAATVNWANNTSAVNQFKAAVTEKTGWIRWNNDQSGVKSSFSAYGTVIWKNASTKAQGTAYSSGTAFKSGNWGTKSSGTALGGEVGPELVVRNGSFFTIGDKSSEMFNYKKGDIIFNAEQTRQIFANGKITNGKKRGQSYAEGTAFSSGSGKIYAKGKVITTPTTKATEAPAATTTTTSTPAATHTSTPTTTSSSTTEEKEPEDFDWIEIVIDRVERAIKKLKTTADSVYKTLSKRLAANRNEISEITKEINIQQAAYTRYMQQANSVGLSSDLASKVRDGTIDITAYDEDTTKLIKDYQEWYEKALDASDAIDELHESLADLYKDRFDNISEDFENQLSMLEHLSNSYEKGLDDLEERGYLGSTAYYEELSKVEKSNIQTLTTELGALKDAFASAVASGEIEKYSSAWYDMQSSINDVSESLQEANTNLIKYKNEIRQIKWDYFDYAQDRVSSLVDEMEFLTDLLDEDDFFDDKGQLSNTGMTAMGLDAMRYDVYMAQADKYRDEIQKLNKEIANDPYDTELIKRREELLGLQQEAIKSANDEKDAIVDLVQDGIDKELESLQDLIDTYSDSIDKAKDLYDYQSSIAEKTEKIAEIQKQISAYAGDDSEENKSRLQGLNSDLSDAQKDLSDTEQSKSISEQKKLLDDLYDQYETILNQRLDNVDLLISDMIATVNDNSSVIAGTITQAASDVGYTMSSNMQNIINSASASMSTWVSNYNGSFNEMMNSVITVLNNIFNSVYAQANKSNSVATTTVEKVKTEAGKTSSGSSSSGTSSSNSSSSKSSSSSSSSGNGFFVVSKDYFPKNKLNIDTSIVDRLKWHDFDSSYSARNNYYKAMGYSGTYSSSDTQNVNMLKWMKANGYSQGGYVAGIQKLIDGNGDDMLTVNTLKKGEAVLPPALAGEWGQLIESLPVLNSAIDSGSILQGVTSSPSVGVSTNNIEINIPIDKVEDYNDFIAKIQEDDQFEKLVQAMTIDQIAGKSKFSKKTINIKR